MIFESLPTTLTSEELIDKAFSRAARTGRAKHGIDAQVSMVQTAANILSDNLENIVTQWPDFDHIDPFYYEVADAIVDVDDLRRSLSEIDWASRKTAEIAKEYRGRMIRSSPKTARKIRKQAFARFADILDEVAADLERIGNARNALRGLPDIRPDEPTIVVAGYPNVGKSSFVNHVTNARNEIASYPFTTKGISVGHVERNHIRYQIVDTPGLLDRPPEDRNKIEAQAVSAITHLADCIIFLVDPSEECGFPIDVQLKLRDSVVSEFGDVPVITVCNKADRSSDIEVDYYMSITADENVDDVLQAAVDAIGYELTLPFEDRSGSDTNDSAIW